MAPASSAASCSPSPLLLGPALLELERLKVLGRQPRHDAHGRVQRVLGQQPRVGPRHLGLGVDFDVVQHVHRHRGGVVAPLPRLAVRPARPALLGPDTTQLLPHAPPGRVLRRLPGLHLFRDVRVPDAEPGPVGHGLRRVLEDPNRLVLRHVPREDPEALDAAHVGASGQDGAALVTAVTAVAAVAAVAAATAATAAAAGRSKRS